MTIRIKTDNNGKDVLWSEVGGKTVPLPVENLYLRLGDGHVFTAVPGGLLQRLNPHEVGMVEHWLRERASEITTMVFAGQTPPATPEAEDGETPVG